MERKLKVEIALHDNGEIKVEITPERITPIEVIGALQYAINIFYENQISPIKKVVEGN